jgi:hypothetical protein
MASAVTPNAFDVETSVLGGRFVTFKFTAGTSGAAPASMTAGGSYLKATPITKSTNDYIFNLASTWRFMYLIGVSVKQATYSAAGAVNGVLLTDSVNSTTAPLFTLNFYAGADGTVVALATGDVVTVTVELTNIKP